MRNWQAELVTSSNDVYKEGTMDLTKIYSGLVPCTALKEGILHQHDCCDNTEGGRA